MAETAVYPYSTRQTTCLTGTKSPLVNYYNNCSSVVPNDIYTSTYSSRFIESWYDGTFYANWSSGSNGNIFGDANGRTYQGYSGWWQLTVTNKIYVRYIIVTSYQAGTNNYTVGWKIYVDDVLVKNESAKTWKDSYRYCVVDLGYNALISTVKFVCQGSSWQSIYPSFLLVPKSYGTITSVTVSPSTADCPGVNKTLQLSFSFSPNNIGTKSVTWKSSDTSIATVSDTGLVTILKDADVTITCTVTSNNSKSGTCVIKGSAIKLTGLTFTAPTNMILNKNQQIQTSLVLIPSNASPVTQKDYTVSNSTKATVSSNGLITFNKVSPVTVIATVTAGGVQKSASLDFVNRNILVADKTISSEIVKSTLGGGQFQIIDPPSNT